MPSTNKFKWLLLSIFISFLPFIYTESTLDPVLTLRFFIFSTVVLVFLLMSKGLLLTKEVFRHPIILILFCIFCSYVLSSFTSSYSYSDSIYQTLKVGLFIVFLLAITKEFNENRGLIFKSGMIFSLLTSLLAIFQIVTSLLNGNLGSEINQITGTMANKNLLSSVLFLAIPFNIYCVYLSKYKIWKILAIVSLISTLLVVLFLQTRAVYIALLLSCIIFVIVKFKSLKKVVFLSSLIALTTCCFIILLNAIEIESDSYVNKLKVELNEIVNLRETLNKQNSLSTRYELYKNSINIIKENPLTGVGPGNWRLEIPKAGLYRTKGETGNRIVQRPHNDFLWVASESGILSGLLYTLLFFFVLKNLYFLSKDSSQGERVFYITVFSVISGYFFISAVDFPMERIEHNVLFYMLIATAVSPNIKPTKDAKHHMAINSIMISICVLCCVVGFLRHKGEVHLTTAKLYKGKQHWQRIIKEIDKAYVPNIYELDRSSTPVHWYSGVAKFSLGQQEAAYKDFKRAHILNPNHLHVLNNLATSYQIRDNSEKAKMYYNDALRISPRFENASVNLAAVLFNEGEIQEALDVILRCNVVKDTKKYNQYLKTIINKSINEYIFSTDLNQSDTKKMLTLKNKLDNDFENVKKNFRVIYELKKTNNSDYIKLYLNYY